MVALLYVAQRSLQYFPERERTTPSAAGLSEAEEAVLLGLWGMPTRTDVYPMSGKHIW
jgi:hypothetical protein